MAYKIIISPDSFKGTMSAAEVCQIAARAAKSVIPDADIVSLPIADGGEGSVDAFLFALGEKRERARVCGPFFGEHVDAEYGVLPNGDAVIEAASCAGLALANGRPSAADGTTYGVGEIISCAVSRGAKKILLCLGGTATNDGGCGMASSLGARFYRRGGEFVPTGRTLHEIEKIDVSNIEKNIGTSEIVALCDVKNPFFGPHGAAYVFAPQKGATESEVKMLDAGLQHLSEVVYRDIGVDISELGGAGAAGGLGGGAVAFLNAKLCSGADAVLDAMRFDEAVLGADLVITGEGCADEQSTNGKAVSVVAARSAKAGVPVVCVAGKIGDGADALYSLGVTDIVQTSRDGAPFDEIKATCRDDLFRAVESAVKKLRSKK